MSKKNKKYMKASNEAPEAEETKVVDNENVAAADAEAAEQTAETQEGEQGAPEPAEEAAAEAATEEEKLLKALAEAEAKYNDLHDKYLRQMAEFENYRKRTLKEKSEIILNGSANLMTAVLPVLDDMDRALDAMAKTDDAESCREGFKLIAAKFRTTLEQNGLKKIDTESQPFDTDFHEAIAMVPATDDVPKGQVIDCVQTGYKLNDKVIRHAKVVVAN